MNELMDAWYALLAGQITYGGNVVPVYKEDAPQGTTSHYILLIAEGEADDSNKRSFSDSAVVIVDIVTIFQNNVDRSVSESIDSAIRNELWNRPGKTNLVEPDGFQFLNTERETSNYLSENWDNSRRVYRKISRYRTNIYRTA